MLRIGLTGGIGAGKTTAAKIFESFGVPVFYSDAVSKSLMFDLEIKRVVVQLFGEESYNGKELNKAHIAAQLFNDQSKREALESVLHPKVRKEFEAWSALQKAPYVINESALLFEKGLASYFDKIILVKAPLEDRIQRVVNRDHSLRSDVEARMALQNNTSENEKLSDFVLNNDNLSSLKSECLRIHNLLTQ